MVSTCSIHVDCYHHYYIVSYYIVACAEEDVGGVEVVPYVCLSVS